MSFQITMARMLSGHPTERFAAIAVRDGAIVGNDVLSYGTSDRCVIAPYRVLAWAVGIGADSVLVGHNHPSGSLFPSYEDIVATVTLQRVLGSALLGHVIEGNGSFFEITRNRYVIPGYVTTGE